MTQLIELITHPEVYAPIEDSFFLAEHLEYCSGLKVLDIGCGTGMSGSVLEDNGHTWIGTDLSESMLQEAFSNTSPSVLLQHDMGTSLPFRPGVFDGAISISAVQWLFSASNRDSNPRKRISTFFRTLHSCLSHGSRAVLQLYATHSPALLDEMTRSATRAGFSGGLVVDFPHSTRAKKSFLVLQAGGNVSGGKGRERKTRKGKVKKKSKEWILAKKERQRRQGLEVRADTKYTARKRRRKF